MRNRIGEPETGVPTRYCLTSTQDPKPGFYAAANSGWFSSADEPLTWTANSPLAGPLRPFCPRVPAGWQWSPVQRYHPAQKSQKYPAAE